MAFDKSKLPSPARYYAMEGVSLKGNGTWRDAICPFHPDTKPSLRVKIETGAFSCMACGAHGGGVVAFHMRLHKLNFKVAVMALGAWVGGVR